MHYTPEKYVLMTPLRIAGNVSLERYAVLAGMFRAVLDLGIKENNILLHRLSKCAY